MRVLHLCAIPQLTGAAEPALDLVRASRALGVEVELYVDTRRPGNLRGMLEAAGERVSRELVLSTKAGAIAGARDVLRLRSLLPRFDVVHTHLSHDHALAAIALGGRRRPLLVRTIHAARVLAPGFGRRWVMRRARGVTVACSAHRARVVEMFGVDAGRVIVLPGSVDASRFHPDPSARAKIRALLGVGEDVFVIGCVARFQAGRRHEVIIDAFARARALVPGMVLLLIGHGETERALRARAGEGVQFPGYKREDLNDWLVALDAAVWLVPGNDATSRAVLQAMAAGVAVIGGHVAGEAIAETVVGDRRGGVASAAIAETVVGGRVGGEAIVGGGVAGEAIAETVVAGETGLLVAPDDVDALARAFVELASDRARARAMGEAGRARAVASFDPIARGRRAIAFYEELIGGHETRALHRGA